MGGQIKDKLVGGRREKWRLSEEVKEKIMWEGSKEENEMILAYP